MLMVALVIRATSAGPALFRQQRVGLHGKPFELLKFRTMTVRTENDDELGSEITVSGDQRVTTVGRLLRASKLDELPELLNIARGDMSVVGPRPEVPRYVDLEDQAWKLVLSVRPGLTDTVTLLLRNEEAILKAGAARTGLDPEAFYRQHLLPFKLEKGAASLAQRSVWEDTKIALRTAGAILGGGTDAESVLELILSEKS